MRRGRFFLFGCVVGLLLVGSFFVYKESSSVTPGSVTTHGSEEGYISLIDDNGLAIVQTALNIGIGDMYINADNDIFEVTDIRGHEAIAVARGKMELPDVSDVIKVLENLESTPEGADESGKGPGTANENDASTASSAVGPRFANVISSYVQGVLTKISAAVGGGNNIDVGIYHTHNAESYEPSSGTAFKDEGDVFQVGRALADALREKGHSVEWSDASHLPHDGQAYMRSRRTALKMARKKPTTILDVHRDAVPDPSHYRTTVDGEQMSRVRLVVGRQNQNREANLEFAKRVKAIADERHPNLIEGIFHAQGNYNQDIGPRMMLLEFGTHVTSLDEAIKSTAPMAEVLAAAAGITPGTGDGNVGTASGKSAVWIVILLIAAGTIWMMVNKEGWNGMKRAFARFGINMPGRDGDDSDGDDHSGGV